MIGLFIQILILLIMVLLVVKPRIGLCLYLACYFLIPSLELSFMGIEATETSGLFALFFVLANGRNFKYIKRIDYSPLSSFFVLYSVLFLLTFFSAQEVPLGFSIRNFVRYIIMTFIIPTGIYTMITCKPEMLKPVKKTMLVVIAIVVTYGLSLTLLPGVNPYIEFLGKEINLPEIHLGSDEGRMFGAISSVFMHPMSFGAMLGYSLCYVLYLKIYMRMSSIIFIVFSTMILLGTLFCGVRSSLAALMGTGAIYLLMKRNLKLLVIATLFVGLAMVVLSYIPILDTYVGSLFQMESDVVRGSSINLRLEQFAASLSVIRDNSIFGNGYAWHSYYIWQNGGYGHYLLHGWESLLFVALTDSGYAGVLVWFMFSVYFCVKFREINIICLFSFFMLYRLFTGTFGEGMFYIFYVLFLCMKSRIPRKRESSNNNSIQI